MESMMAKQPSEKLLIIGLDGATFDRIDPLAAEGKLPNLGELMRTGSRARLRSTLPAHSAPAWTSCVTGVNPGKHGIVSFFRWLEEDHRFLPVNANDIQYPPLWRMLQTHSVRYGFFNLPVGYPPSQGGGYMVGGMMAPNIEAACYPEDLAQEILELEPGYVIEAPIIPDRKARLEGILRQMERRERVAHFLRRRYPTDFTMVVFTGLDRLQHFYWADMDPHHPLYSQVVRDGLSHGVEAGYRQLDKAVGNLLDSTDPSTTVLVVSDHGFQAIYRRFFVNRWLVEQGLLALRGEHLAASAIIKETAHRLGLRSLLSRLKRALPIAKDVRMGSLSFAAVDWSRTKAVAGPDMGILFPGSNGKESLLDRVRDGLLDLRDPESGEPVVEAALHREAVYTGSAVSMSPDIVIQTAVHTEEKWKGAYVMQDALEADSVFRPPGRVHGAHAPDGILIARGPGIRAGAELEGASILDITPTSLYMLGLPAVDSMDGKVLGDLFTSVWLEQNPPPTPISEETVSQARHMLDERETILVEERLRGLGYLE